MSYCQIRFIIPKGNVVGDDASAVVAPNDEVVYDKINDKIDEPISIPLLQRLGSEVKYMYKANVVTLEDIVDMHGTTIQTARRDMKLLRNADIAVLVGSRKTGRYMLTEAGKDLFNNMK